MAGKSVEDMVRYLAPIHEALGLTPDTAAIERVIDTWAKKPAWVTEGYMPPRDALVVHEVARAAPPGAALEIGTASGMSICAVALGLEAAGMLDRTEIHTYDSMEHCYFDSTRVVGSAAAEVLPELAPRIGVHAGQPSSEASRRHEPGSVTMAIIDGDHRHPFPMIDMAMLCRALAPGAWVALHDIYLPRFTFKNPKDGTPMHYTHTGAEKLYAAWPWEKAEPAPDGYVNIGIVRVPDGGLTPERLLDILDVHPFDEGVAEDAANYWLEQSGIIDRAGASS